MLQPPHSANVGPSRSRCLFVFIITNVVFIVNVVFGVVKTAFMMVNQQSFFCAGNDRLPIINNISACSQATPLLSQPRHFVDRWSPDLPSAKLNVDVNCLAVTWRRIANAAFLIYIHNQQHYEKNATEAQEEAAAEKTKKDQSTHAIHNFTCSALYAIFIWFFAVAYFITCQ